MYYDAAKRDAEQNKLFLDMVKEGMTQQELKALIKLRPNLWGKWSNWLDKLPDGDEQGVIS
jgi:hypothetical protein